jgi:hypothetical protein
MILKQRGTDLTVMVFEGLDAKIVQKVNGSQQSRKTVVQRRDSHLNHVGNSPLEQVTRECCVHSRLRCIQSTAAKVHQTAKSSDLCRVAVINP